MHFLNTCVSSWEPIYTWCVYTYIYISSWWLNHPVETYARQIGSFLPGIGVKITKYVKPPTIQPLSPVFFFFFMLCGMVPVPWSTKIRIQGNNTLPYAHQTEQGLRTKFLDALGRIPLFSRQYTPKTGTHPLCQPYRVDKNMCIHIHFYIYIYVITFS